MQAFGYVLNEFTSAHKEFLEELIEEPIMFHPKFGHTGWDGILGQNLSKKLWTSSAIRRLAEQWYYHIQAIQKSISKNEYMMIELASIINNFSIECYTYLLLLNDEIIEDVFGQKIRPLLTTIAIEGIDTKQLDAVAQCIAALADQGCYGTKNNVGNAMVDITFDSKKDLEKIRKYFIEKTNGCTKSEFRFIFSKLLNANKRILVDQLTFQESKIKFEEAIEISKIINILGLEYVNVQVDLEDIMVPILLHYFSDGKEDKLREVAMSLNDILPFNQETTLQSFKIILDHYQKSGQRPSQFYKNQIPKNWLSLMIQNLSSILDAITSSGPEGKPEEILEIFEHLAIIAFRMQDYNLALTIIKTHIRASVSLLKVNKDYAISLYDLPACIIYSCLLNKKDDIAVALIREISSYGKFSKEIASEVTYHFTHLGIFAQHLEREQVVDFIIDQLIELEKIYPNHKLGSLVISAKSSGYTNPNYSYLTPEVGYSDEGYFEEDSDIDHICSLLKLNKIENPDKKYASQFMRKLALQFLMLAHKRSILFNNIIC